MPPVIDPVEVVGTLRLPYAYVPYAPTVKQELFLRSMALEAFFGGAAGGGKSVALLMSALMYVDVPGYHGLLLRPSLTEFQQPGALIEVSHEWLGGTDATWNGSEHEWTFPSGSTIRFGYLAHVGDLSRYKGPSYSYCGWDELTSFTEQLYRGMFRILRQQRSEQLGNVPLRMRSASNPGDRGHSWVRDRFITEDTREPGAVYVRSLITDNPHLDYDAYLESLAHMTAIDRERLIRGDWDVSEEGGKFRRGNFEIIEPEQVTRSVKAVRYWDLAGTEPSQSNKDPDWTVGLRLDVDDQGIYTVRDLVALRAGDADVEAAVQETARLDGRGIEVVLEQDPGQAGKAQVSHYQRNVLPGWPVYAGHTRINGRSAAKEVRARPVAAATSNGLVRVVRGPHVREFLDSASMFPLAGYHDDYVDALSGSYNWLTRAGRPRAARSRIAVPTAILPIYDSGRGRI